MTVIPHADLTLARARQHDLLSDADHRRRRRIATGSRPPTRPQKARRLARAWRALRAPA